MASNAANAQPTKFAHRTGEPSLVALVQTAIADAREFVRAEVELHKADLKTTLGISAAVLIVVTAGGTVLVGAVALLTAALSLALHGGAIAALLASAGTCVLCVIIAATWLRARLRSQASEKVVAPAARIEGTAQVSPHV